MPGASPGQQARQVWGRPARIRHLELFFENVRVPSANLLGPEGMGFIQMMMHLPQERIGAAVGNIANISRSRRGRSSTPRTARRSASRSGTFQQSSRSPVVTMVEVAEAYIDDCVLAHTEHKLTPVDAAKAKWWSSQVQCDVLDECVQLHGGYGFMNEYRVARAWKDARVHKIWAGTNEIMKELIGRTSACDGSARGRRRGRDQCLAGHQVRDRPAITVAEGRGWSSPPASPDALADAVTRLGGPEHATAVAGFTSVEAHRRRRWRPRPGSYGPVNLLVNNTGITRSMARSSTRPLDAAQIMDTNVLAAFAWTQKAVAAGWAGNRPGAVVQHRLDRRHRRDRCHRDAGVPKAALIHLTLEMGYQLAPGRRVNAVAPPRSSRRSSPRRCGRGRGQAAALPDAATRHPGRHRRRG